MEQPNDLFSSATITPRVLNVISSLGAGGAERQLSILAAALARGGLKVAVGYQTGGPNLERLQDSQAKLYKLPERRSHDPRQLFDIASIVKDFCPDIIHTWLLKMDVLGGVIAKLTGLKHILSERTSAYAYSSVDTELFVRATIGRRADAIVANSRGGLEYWERLKPRGKTYLIRNAVAPLELRIPKDTLGLSNTNILVAASRLTPGKNLAVVVQAFAAALVQLPKHHAVIFGDGPEREQTAALIHATGFADRFHLAGYTDCLPWWLSRADVFVSASLLEGNPNVVIEAAQCGCPMVLSDIPAHREFVASDHARFVPCDNSSAFGKAIVDLATNRVSAAIISKNAQSIIQGLQVENIALEYARVYEKLARQDT